MKFAVDARTGQRIVVLRPADAALALRRLAEWNEILDRATEETKAAVTAEGNEHWKMLQKEQSWRFMGWLADDLKTLLGHDGAAIGAALPGDMNVDPREGHLWGQAS